MAAIERILFFLHWLELQLRTAPRKLRGAKNAVKLTRLRFRRWELSVTS
jgi:hypothetical protein